MTKAVFAGSFDPIHLGHLDIIRRAAGIFDQVVVAVTVNLEKNCMFSFEERAEMIRLSCGDLKNVSVEACTGLLADYVNNGGFNVSIKSLRCGTDLDYEMPVAQMHSRLYNKCDTVFLLTAPEYGFISSTQVRQVFSLGGDVSFMVAPETLEFMQKVYKSRGIK